MCKWTLKIWRYIDNNVEKRRNCSLGAISPLFHIIFLPVVRFSCLGRDQIFTSRLAVIPDKRGRENESQLYLEKVIITYHSSQKAPDSTLNSHYNDSILFPEDVAINPCHAE